MIFIVKGIPQPWRRARTGKRGYFTDAKTVEYKNRIALCARQAGVELLEGPVFLSLDCFWSSRKPDLKHNRRGVEWMDKRPDIDNILKVYLDALQGIAFIDDGQVVHTEARKFRAEQGEEPRVDIRIFQKME